MQKWLISADTKKWNHTELFARDGYIDWEKHLNYDVGDIVYIYAKKTKESDGKIMFKTFVEKIFPCLNDEGKEIECARLHLIQQVDKEELYLENLKKFYFIPPMKGFRFNGQLENYIDMYFDDDYDSDDVKNMWLIHEDEESQKKELFKNHNYVAGDWQVGDLSDLDYESVKSEFFKAYENFASPNAISKYSSQYNLFVNQINVGDYIISSNKSKKEYILGECVSDYYFSDKSNEEFENQCKHYRDVKWLYCIKWDDISKKARDSIFHAKTVIQIKDRLKDEFLDFFKYVPFQSEEGRNKIYFGAPGTGKSRKLDECKDELLDDINNYERVTFHPDYTYGNFVGSYKPISEEDSIKYEYVPGPFMRVLKKALENPSEPYLLIIEEINRANIAAVFGDVFQLLDRDNYDKSEYPIETSEEIKKYLNRTKIRIPSNMFIWATMNSADQGVFTMDTAFKRRWEFEYISINEGASKIKNLKVELYGKEFLWNDIRIAINKKLLGYGINEDKLMGPFFAFKEFIDDEVIPEDKFKKIFKNKIIMYLFEDAARSRRDKLFSGIENNENLIYSDICDNFDNEEIGLKIFNKEITNKLFSNDSE